MTRLAMACTMKILRFLAVLLIGSVVCGAPGVWFASEGGIGFALIKGYEVKETSYTSDITTQSFCHCRRLCFVTPGCNGASYADETDGNQCRMFTVGFFSNVFGSNDNATLTLRNTTGKRFHIGVDGRVYLVLNVKKQLKNAAIICNRIPGFHLGIYKDMRSTEALQQFHESFGYDDVAVGMSFYDSMAYWSDSTPFEQQIYQADTSGSDSYYMLRNKEFKRAHGDTEVNVVCQADLQNGKH